MTEKFRKSAEIGNAWNTPHSGLCHDVNL